MADRITPGKLKTLFIEIMQKSNDFTFLDGIQPFLITFSGNPYYVYIKHLSSAYFKDRPDTTRAQLPIRPDFDEIKKSSIPFIFLGYDITNDVYVCWNYHIAKNRLNEKESVSFYSRESFQKEVKQGNFLRKKLKNDDIPVLFKRNDLIKFFENINTFFNKDELGLTTMEEIKDYDGKLYKITEPEILDQIQVMINSSSYNILSAISLVQKIYGDKYPNMKYSDWSNLVKSVNKTNTKEIIKENTNEKQLTVKQIIVKILRARGGEASYSDIYKDFEKFVGKSITSTQKAGIRATIERASSDSSQFSGTTDLFYSCKGKGNGWWGLRELSKENNNC